MKDTHGGDIWKAARDSKIPPDRIIDFSASINPLGMPEGAARALKAAIEEGRCAPYPDPGATALREAIAAFHALRPEEVLPANGSTELIYLLPRFIGGKTALIIEPAFSEYARALALAGCRVKRHILDVEEGFALDPGRLFDSLNGVEALYLANPANPTGVLYPKREILRIADECDRRGVFFIVDEAFADFSGPGGSICRECAGLKNTIVLRSMTKFYSMAGLRLGYALSNKTIMEGLSAMMPPWSVNTLAAIAGIEALKDALHIEKTAQWLSEERAFLMESLSGIPGITPFESSVNYIMFKTAPGISEKIIKSLASKGILVRDLSAFHGLGAGFIRVAVRTRRENGLLIESILEAVSLSPV